MKWLKTIFPPIITWAKNHKILAAILILFLIIVSNFTNPPADNSSNNSADTKQNKNAQVATVNEPLEKVKEESKPIDQPTPAPEKTPEQIFQEVANKVTVENTLDIKKEGDGWVISNDMYNLGDLFQFSKAKQLSRDFIFGIYATGLPVKHVRVIIYDAPTKKYYKAGLGKDKADIEGPSTWTSSVGPTIFHDFLVKNTNGEAEDKKYSTYVETNLD